MREKIISYLKSKKYEIEETPDGILTVHQFQNKIIRIFGDLGKNFPLSLPILYLVDRNKYGLLGHVAWDKKNNRGSICTGVSANRSIDYSNPEIIYEKCLLEGLKTLIDSLSDEKFNRNEIIKEFNAHWNWIASKEIINLIEPSTILKTTKVFETKNKDVYSLEESSEINLKYSYLKELQDRHILTGKGVYLPLTEEILPPSPADNISIWWNDILKKFSNLEKELLKLIESKPLKTLWIIASIKSKDKYSWFALKFVSSQKNKVQIKKREDFSLFEVIPFSVKLHNKEYILPRGGALKSEKKSILIVGCGSVGGEIANNVAASGLVKNITLVDFDNLEIENMYRHILGGKYIGNRKVVSLQKELMNKYPYLDVKYKVDSIKNLLQMDFINSFDGIIMATGDATLERYFNDKVFEMEKKPWIIYSWLEAYGVGGHTIYIHNSNKGCLSCLYRNIYGEKSLHSIQNFIDAEQNTSIDISGCGGYFLPYSILDAKETALLTSRITLKALLGEFKESKRISWKGEISSDINLKTTYRYNENKETCLKLSSLYWEKCDICNGEY